MKNLGRTQRDAPRERGSAIGYRPDRRAECEGAKPQFPRGLPPRGVEPQFSSSNLQSRQRLLKRVRSHSLQAAATRQAISTMAATSRHGTSRHEMLTALSGRGPSVGPPTDQTSQKTHPPPNARSRSEDTGVERPAIARALLALLA